MAGWKIPHQWRIIARKIIEKRSIFQHAMFDDTGGYVNSPIRWDEFFCPWVFRRKTCCQMKPLFFSTEERLRSCRMTWSKRRLQRRRFAGMSNAFVLYCLHIRRISNHDEMMISHSHDAHLPSFKAELEAGIGPESESGAFLGANCTLW